MVIPDYPYLNQFGDVPPQLLRDEHQTMRRELEILPPALARWRADAPAGLWAGLDRLGMAVIQCIEEMKYFETCPFLELLCERMQAIEAAMSAAIMNPVPVIPDPRIIVAPSSGSDGVVAHMGRQALQSANSVLLARALAEYSNDMDHDGPNSRP